MTISTARTRAEQQFKAATGGPPKRPAQVRAESAARALGGEVEGPTGYKGDWLRDAIARGKREPFAIVAEITPGVAKRLLERNPENRHISIPAVGKLVRDIDAGHWQFNGESIVVARGGELNDGQHRLQAVLNTGKSIRSVMVFGVDRDTRETLDTGKARNLADWLGLHGVKNATTVAAMARMVMAYERAKGEDFTRTNHFSIQELLDRGINDAALHDVARHAMALYLSGGRDLASATAIGVCLYLLERVDKIEGRNFVDRVFIGDNIARESAAFRTRRLLMLTNDRRMAMHCAIVLHGWHAHRTGKGGPVAEYPLPKL